jgi:FkbM family methyltransferase
MKSRLKALMPQTVKKPLKEFMGFKTMGNRLLNLRHAGFNCTGAIDVGAYHGDWTKAFRSVWKAPVIMVEPQVSCKNVLERYASEAGNPGVHLECCALGKAPGVVDFILEETNSRFDVSGNSDDAASVKVPVKTLHEVTSNHDERFNLLKIDVQGFELDVLEGVGKGLKDFEVIILEVSIIRIGPVPVFYEVMQYMDRRGYRLYDFLPMYYRPLDNALWQGDAFFVRNDSALVSSLNWN